MKRHPNGMSFCNKRFSIMLFVVFTLISCDPEVQIEKQYVIVGNINRVLILGNSITVTQPAPEIGWYGHWGMAASAERKDYVHLLIEKFKQYNDTIQVEYLSISSFERDFSNYDVKQLSAYRDFAPDLIIVRIGENVDENLAKSKGFANYLSKLLIYLKNGRTVAVCSTSTFWSMPKINEEIKKLADAERHIYVPIIDLSKDKKNSAHDQFENGGVGAHPSDRGMQNIADRIAGKLGIF